MSLQWKFTVFTPPDLLRVEVDHFARNSGN